MKKSFALIAAILFAYQISNAQTQKGTRNLSINLNYGSTNSKSSQTDASIITQVANSSKSFDIGPSYGYFVANGMELGASVSYNSSSQINSQTSISNNYYFKQQNNGRQVSVFFRKYALYENKIGFRAGPYVGYGRSNIKSVNINGNVEASHQDGTSNTFSAGAGIDLIYYPTNKIGIAANLATLQYSHYKQNGSMSDVTTETFGVRALNNALALSVYYVLGAK